MEFIKSFMHGAVELGLFFAFGVPAILFVIAIFLMGFQEGNILSFVGRTNRKAFIIKILLILIGGSILGCIFAVLAVKLRSTVFFIGAVAVFLGIAVAYYANMARRLHDIDQSAWWALVYFVLAFFLNHEGSPFQIIALILLIVLAAIPGTKGPNKYGADPLEKLR